ncbi:site-specific integrase [Reichenbachiella versicolor]|uniref:site-specific integrase n=1 Tax=Reichenbachiella versicolor TaxID=1821036 RepID=UPI000D6DF217|nr:site-specific integrase [Reichenbachiella versicolor]
MIKYTLVHNRKNIIGKDGKALVQIKCYSPNTKRNKFLSTDTRLEPNQWDSQKCRVTPYFAQYISLNRILDDKIKKLQDYEISILERGKECSLEMIEQYHLNGKVNMTFNEFVEDEISNCTLRSGTIRQHRGFQKKLDEFNSKLLFSQIDFDLCCRFEKCLRDEDLHVNTVANHFKMFKRFVNLAIDKEYMEINKNPFIRFKAKTVPPKKTFLTHDEVKRIEKLELNENSELDRARDFYLFGVYTALRFSDIKSLRKDNIMKTDDGQWQLYIQMQKTTEPLSIPLHLLFEGKPKDIIDKHEQLNPTSEKCFNCYSNEYQNRLLKIIAQMAKIDKRLSFHSSRHSFATNLLNYGIPIEIVQALMGHKKIQQTQEYAKLLNVSVNRELSKVWS